MSGRLLGGYIMQSVSISCDEEDPKQQSSRKSGLVNEVEVNLLTPQRSRLASSVLSPGISSRNGVAEWVSSHSAETGTSNARLDNRTDEIIQEARNAVPCKRGQVGYLDDRTERIIQEALREKVNRNAKLRSTDEVLQLAGKVLSIHKSNNEPADDERHEEQEDPKESFDEYLSPSVSGSGASLEDYEKAVAQLSSKLSSSPSMNREMILNKIDGIIPPFPEPKGCVKEPCSPFNILEYFWGSQNASEKDQNREQENEAASSGQTSSNTQVLLASNSIIQNGTSIPLPCHSEKIPASETDPRMPSWVKQQECASQAETEQDTTQEQGGFYSLGRSRTIIVHEIIRGDWTWCTAWSPDGTRLAIATENHHLAVVDTAASTVWRVKHDRRISLPMRKDTTHTIRAIAWGSQFIAIGGTGNAVSILAPSDPYPIIHMIQQTGFVGSLDWKPNSAVLAIGSRNDKCLIVSVFATAEDDGSGPPGRGRRIDSTILHTIDRKDWVNVVSFSPGGTILAVGDKSGKLSLFNYKEKYDAPSILSRIAKFVLDDSVLAVEWSPDGKWLYAGGEDYTVTVIDTASWEITGRLKRDRWVQFIESSHRGSHIAVGGVASEVTILDANEDWKPVMKVELKGLVPLSARWHPKDQFLALTGQNKSVLAIETTDARHVKGYFLRSISAILAVEFSPDGLTAAIGNKDGLVSFYKLSEPTFVTCYEMVLAGDGSQSIQWSSDGQFVVIGNGRSVIIIGRTDPQSIGGIPPNSSGFSVRKVIRSAQVVHSVSINGESKYVAVGGGSTRILDATDNFSCVKEWKKGVVLANAWSPDGAWLAMIGKSKNLTIYDTSSDSVGQWRVIFTLHVEETGLALAWANMGLDGLQYLAYGGEAQKITIIEIRTQEETWETVLEVPRANVIHDLDWNSDGILAAAIGDGTVSILDLGYLRSGWPVNEMDYNWQRQGMVCSVELRRNRGKNSMRTVKWMPTRQPTDKFLAVGGTDGALEVVDLTERQHCKGFGVSDSFS